MSFWKRLFSGREEAAPPSTPPPPSGSDTPPVPDESPDASEGARAADEADAEATELARLRRVGRPGGAEIGEAIALLSHHSGSARQTKCLNALLEGLDDDPALDPIRVACATLLDERGDRARAKLLLAPTRSVAGMMLLAELSAAAGNLPRAVSMVERVLARDIDTPGARERHERWSAQLGRDDTRAPSDDGATVVAPNQDTTTYRLIREIARGGAGTIYEAEDELLGRRVAFKVYHRAEQDHAQIAREAQTAVRLAGPGVLRIFDADPTRGWLATELVACGSLREHLRGGRVAELFPLSRWLPRLLAALERVHTEGLVHADIKPANVLFRAPGDPVLGDFGVCAPAGSPPIGGTPGYMSPERLDGGASETRDDVYALGRIIEDVLGARDDAALDGAALAASEAEARRYAKIALACLADADERPPDAMAVAKLVEASGEGEGEAQ